MSSPAGAEAARTAAQPIEPAPEEALLTAWAERLGGPCTCQRLAEQHYVFRVRAPGRNYILKEAGLINPQGDVPRKLAAEAGVLRHLQARGIGVAVPELTDGGQPYQIVGDRYYTLSPEVPSDPDESAPPERVYRSFGAAIARLHEALASYPGPIYSWTMDMPPRILDEAARDILQGLDEQQLAAFQPALEALRQPITGRLSGLPSQHIHGDCHGGNIMRVGDAVSGFIDLDHLPYGPRLYDLCYLAANDVNFNHHKPGWAYSWFSAILPSLFDGYAQEAELTGAEKDAAPYMILGILLIFAGWFFRCGSLVQANQNLQAFYWVCEHQERVRESIR